MELHDLQRGYKFTAYYHTIDRARLKIVAHSYEHLLDVHCFMQMSFAGLGLFPSCARWSSVQQYMYPHFAKPMPVRMGHMLYTLEWNSSAQPWAICIAMRVHVSTCVIAKLAIYKYLN